MNSNDILKLVTATYKDSIQAEFLQNFETEYNALLLAEADARRSKQSNNIVNMARLKMALNKFEFTYLQIKKSSGSIEAIEDYMLDITYKIKMISYNKNKQIR